MGVRSAMYLNNSIDITNHVLNFTTYWFVQLWVVNIKWWVAQDINIMSTTHNCMCQ